MNRITDKERLDWVQKNKAAVEWLGQSWRVAWDLGQTMRVKGLRGALDRAIRKDRRNNGR